MIIRWLLLILMVTCAYPPLVASQPNKVIYRGVQPGAYSLPLLMLKTIQQPDVIELPLVLSRNNQLVVFDDIFLQSQTNVVDIFPERSRQDGNYYVVDFSLAEIEQLSYRAESASLSATVHPASFSDTLNAISAISKHLSKTPQILPVIKYPWFHTNESKDISKIIIDTLIAKKGTVDSPLYLKCYDPEELQRIKKQKLPGLPVEIKLIQGIDRVGGRETMRNKRGTWYSYNYDWVFTRLGLRVLAGYADGLSLRDMSTIDKQTLSRLIVDSHGLQMKVFIEVEDTQLSSHEKLFDYLIFTLAVDGLTLSRPQLLQDFLTANRQELPEDTFNTSTPPKPESTSILSDPEELSRRLQTLEE